MKPAPDQDIRGRADRIAAQPLGSRRPGETVLMAYITGDDGRIYRVEMELTPEAAAHIRHLLPEETISGRPMPAPATVDVVLWSIHHVVDRDRRQPTTLSG